MRRGTHLLLATALSCAVVLAGTGFAAGDTAAGGANNVVLVSNSLDNTPVARSKLAVAHDRAPTVANANIASASSTNCTGCRTVAVAMQLVVVEGSPQDFEPANVATATNGNCSSCQTYAFAYQYVVQPAQVVYLGADAQRALHAIRDQAEAIASSNDTYAEMKVELDAVFAQFVETANEGFRAAGAPAIGHEFAASNAA